MPTSARDRRVPAVPRTWWALALVQVLVLVASALAIPGLRSAAPVARSTHAASTPAASTRPAARATPPDKASIVDAVNRALAARDRALVSRNRAAYLAAAKPWSAALRAAAALFTNIAQVPLSEWVEAVDASSLTPVAGSAVTYTVDVVRRYRIKGFDPGGVPQRRRLTVARSGATWTVVTDTPAAGERRELWESGPVVVRRGTASIVLAHPGDESRLARYAAIADAAVRNVSSVWGDDWSRHVVVVVPSTTVELGRLLDSAADYAQIAALATADVVDTGGLRTALADRVVINPGTFGRLTDLGQRIVMTHEVTHVASRLATGKSSPSWLVEGFADYVAYRTNKVPTSVAARDLTAAVRRRPLPAALPSDSQFDPAAADLGATYELAWLACRFIAERTGQAKLLEFYKAVGAATGPEDEAVRRAFAGVLDSTPETFATSWRSYVAAAVS
ncbi:MAG: hypothetical protein QOF57_1282 [Frankiaceae bacterium]|nr:hypothetical protein [Frankiaceae bacterium]MDQ1726112.1 hypothetical protein [Frankiaceae bacterium]